MQKEEIIILANQTYKKFNTVDPFKIAYYLDYIVIFKDMPPKIRGYTLRKFRINIIYLNENLNDADIRNTLLHELGHIFCKHDENRIFTSLKTRFVTAKLENEADLFSVAMLLNTLDKEDLEKYTLKQISYKLGIEESKMKLYFFWNKKNIFL